MIYDIALHHRALINLVTATIDTEGRRYDRGKFTHLLENTFSVLQYGNENIDILLPALLFSQLSCLSFSKGNIAEFVRNILVSLECYSEEKIGQIEHIIDCLSPAD